ncbi:MAG: hypothetical protein RLZ45_3068 [Verrucomicrobiota bacterium]
MQTRRSLTGRAGRRSRPQWRLGRFALLLLASAGAAFSVWMVWGGLRAPALLEQWPPSGPGFEPWRTLEPGVEYCRIRRTAPREIRGHVLRFDLGSHDLEMVMPFGQPSSQGGTRAEWPLTWLRRDGLIAVVNATPFLPEPILPGGSVRLQGLAVSEGHQWSPPVPNLDSVVLTSSGRIEFTSAGQNPSEIRCGAGGFLIIRRNGENTLERTEIDAVTVVGASADRRWLYWIVVDGKQPGYSEGLSAHEASNLIGELGVTDAIRMDGGASTTIAVAGGWIGGRVLNRPRNWLYPGLPHPVGNVLGIRRRATSR